MSKSKLSLICLAILLALPSIAFAQRAVKGVLPVVSSIAPTSATAGGPGFALTVSGSNFSTGSIVLWNGNSLSTTHVSATQLQATIAGGLIAAAGTAQVAVYTPGRGGGTSNLVAFTINPAPTTTTTTTGTPLAITTASLPIGMTGTAYSQALAASGGTVPYAWSATSGTVPPGLTLSSTGAVSGTPTTAGSYAFTAQVRDSVNATSSLTYSVSIAAGATSPLAVSTASVPGGTAGTAYSTTLAATGGTAPHTWSVAAGSTLPPGLALSAAGTISGTPDMPAAYAFSVQVRDSANNTAPKSYSMTVDAPGTFAAVGGCGTDANGNPYDQSGCGNVGNPYADYPGGTQPAADTLVSACGTLNPTKPGHVFRVSQNIGTDPTQQCILVAYANYNFTLDLNGKTVTGRIKDVTNQWGDAIMAGTVNCSFTDSFGCVAVFTGTTATALTRVHHLTINQLVPSPVGGQTWNLTMAQQNAVSPVAAISLKADHVDGSVPSQVSTGRPGFMSMGSGTGGATPFEVSYCKFSPPADAAQAQGIGGGPAPGSYVHNNYIALPHPSYDTNAYSTDRAISIDCEGNAGQCSGATVAYNVVVADNNRAIRVRAVTGVVIHHNIIYNCRSVDLAQTSACVHLGGTDVHTELTSAEVYSNTIEMTDGNGIMLQGSSYETANVHNNTFTCYQGNCSTAGWAMLTQIVNPGSYPTGIAAAQLTFKNNFLPPGLNPNQTILACGPPGNTSYVCNMSGNTASVVHCNNSGYSPVGNGTMTQQCP